MANFLRVHTSLNLMRNQIYIIPQGSKLLSVQRHPILLRAPLIPSKILPLTRKRLVCRSSVFEDTPFVVAIGACIFSSLLLVKQVDENKVESQRNSGLGEDDVRDGAMTIISLIPIFNWLGWIFAWLDTNEQRFLFYAAVYLAPYVRTGFSFNSDENWLLILCYMACIAHVQVEISARSGDVEFGFKNGLRQIQRNIRSRLLGDHSRRFTDSVVTEDKVQNSPMEEVDISKIELSQFDRKLFDVKRMKEDEAQRNTEDDKQNKKD